MKGAVLYGPRDVRYVEREEPKIMAPTDVILRLSATSVCGSSWRRAPSDQVGDVQGEEAASLGRRPHDEGALENGLRRRMQLMASITVAGRGKRGRTGA